MNPEDSSRTFAHGSQYRMACQAPNQGRLFLATCRDGQWFGDRSQCTSTDILGGLRGALDNLFGRRRTTSTVPQPSQDEGMVPVKAFNNVPGLLLHLQ